MLGKNYFHRFNLVVFLLMAMQGCVPLVVGGAIGAAGYAYVKGHVVKNLDASVAEVNEASSIALRELNYFVTLDELNLESSRITAEDEKAKQIDLRITALTARAAQIKIRVGWMGNEVESIQILQKIEEHL